MKKMETFEALLDVLQEEVRIYRSLIDLLQEEQKGLILADLEVIEEVEKKKETVYLKSKLLEESRQTLVEKICSLCGIPGEDPPLSRIIQASGGRCSVPLSACQGELRELLTTVQNLVKMNEGLVGTSLDFIRGSLSIFQHPSGQPVYSPDGQIETKEESECRVNQRA
ncbi:MAG: flagellar protein FlgN [Deltaproteobacteria bacterium]|nr:flagellar protein FlgN [Deltaproteobacteria bacterium]